MDVKYIPVIPDMGDDSPVLRLRTNLLPGHKRAMQGLADEDDEGGVTDILLAFAIDGLEGDWSKLANLQIPEGHNGPYTPPWPKVRGRHRLRALDARIAILELLSDDVVAPVINHSLKLLGINEDESGN